MFEDNPNTMQIFPYLDAGNVNVGVLCEPRSYETSVVKSVTSTALEWRSITRAICGHCSELVWCRGRSHFWESGTRTLFVFFFCFVSQTMQRSFYLVWYIYLERRLQVVLLTPAKY